MLRKAKKVNKLYFMHPKLYENIHINKIHRIRILYNFRYLDLTLLKDSKFIAMCLSVTLMSTGCPYMLYFLPAYALSAGN